MGMRQDWGSQGWESQDGGDRGWGDRDVGVRDGGDRDGGVRDGGRDKKVRAGCSGISPKPHLYPLLESCGLGLPLWLSG